MKREISTRFYPFGECQIQMGGHDRPHDQGPGELEFGTQTGMT